MLEYCVDRVPQQNGYHEVHKMSCRRVREFDYLADLGHHASCYEAVAEAKKLYPYSPVNGCVLCSRDCHVG